MQYIITNIVPIAATTLVGLAVLWIAFRARLRGSLLGIAALALFWLAAILAGALILAPVDAGAWTIALGTAFIIWVGFVLPALAVALPLRGAALGSAMADAAWWLVLMIAQAATLQTIGLIKPAATTSASSAASEQD